MKQAGSRTRYARFLEPLVAAMHWREQWNEELDAMLAGIEEASPMPSSGASPH